MAKGLVILADRVRQMRGLAILTQAELAEKVGCSVGTIARIERSDARVIVPTIRALGKVFGCKPQDLLKEISQRSQ